MTTFTSSIEVYFSEELQHYEYDIPFPGFREWKKLCTLLSIWVEDHIGKLITIGSEVTYLWGCRTDPIQHEYIVVYHGNRLWSRKIMVYRDIDTPPLYIDIHAHRTFSNWEGIQCYPLADESFVEKNDRQKSFQSKE